MLIISRAVAGTLGLPPDFAGAATLGAGHGGSVCSILQHTTLLALQQLQVRCLHRHFGLLVRRLGCYSECTVRDDYATVLCVRAAKLFDCHQTRSCCLSYRR